MLKSRSRANVLGVISDDDYQREVATTGSGVEGTLATPNPTFKVRG
jgi:hypothetical protein